ncbi:MAG: ATP-binding protein [Nanoarchaeota archaeon]|nr:ATP-binding protein [Nanoarchaeota archaeon]
MNDLLPLQNPWWKTGNVPEKYIGKYRRELFDKVMVSIEDKKVTSIIGPRQAGKTTLIHEIISHLLKSKVEPERIIYAQFDTASMIAKGVITEIINNRAAAVNEAPDSFKKKIYVFIDEAHKLETWAEEVKQWHDLRLNIKFVVTGSSSLRVLKGSGESLLGRIRHFMLLPMNFREFLEAKYGIKAGNASLDLNALNKLNSSLAAHIHRIKLAFSEYILRGGYPDTISKDVEDTFRLLIDYKDLSLQRDMFETENVRDIKSIKELVSVLAGIATERMNYSKIASILGIKSDTVKRYIGLLEDTYLVKELKVFSKKPYFSVRRERKIAFIDSGMANAINSRYELTETDKAKLVENLVARAVFEARVKKEISADISYWLSESGKEIDCIAELEHIIPIEAKYRESINEDAADEIMQFMGKFNAETGIVVTKDILKEEKAGKKKILFIPAWLFALAF